MPVKKFLQLPLRIAFWIALAISGAASAQLSATFTVQRNYSVPRNAGSYSDVTAACPAGYVALSGGLDSFGSNDLEITRLAPTFGGATLDAQVDGTRAAADGWMASVINYGAAARVVAVTAVCSPVSGVVVAIATDNVTASANGVSGFALPFVSCPAGQVALGGGVFTSRPEAMKLTASSPTFGLGNAYVYSHRAATSAGSTRSAPTRISIPHSPSNAAA